jgi:hypothetical protein
MSFPLGSYEILEDVRSHVRKNIEVRNSISFDEKSNNLKTRRGLQHFFSTKFENEKQQKIYEIVLNHALKAEKESPGAGIELLKLFSGQISVSDKKAVKTKNDIIEVIKNYKLSKRNFDIIKTVLEYSNSNSRISFKKSSSQHAFVEITDGHTFEASCQIPVVRKDYQNVKVICIDGYIENVSEIHHILEHFSQNRVPCLIFSRGMSDDVLHTIKVNNNRGTLSIYPYRIPFDIDSVNTLVDIAVVSSTDVTSSLKGELISSIAVEKIKSIEKCTLFGNKVILKNSLSKISIDNHVKNIRNSIKEKPELTEILSKRIKSLTSSCIEISLPEDINFYSDSQQIDESIRTIMSVISNTFDVSRVSQQHFESLEGTLNAIGQFVV